MQKVNETKTDHAICKLKPKKYEKQTEKQEQKCLQERIKKIFYKILACMWLSVEVRENDN